MRRRVFLSHLLGVGAIGYLSPILGAEMEAKREQPQSKVEKVIKSDAEWKKSLAPEQYAVLRQEATEPAFTSPLNNEKRNGQFVCAACILPLFTSEMKFDSGTGWPSFFRAIPEHLETRTDFKLVYPRVEYHCARCGGHQGHVFNDGPPPTGKRWCNNGVALKFVRA